jgi:hypothetical protein
MYPAPPVTSTAMTIIRWLEFLNGDCRRKTLARHEERQVHSMEVRHQGLTMPRAPEES